MKFTDSAIEIRHLSIPKNCTYSNECMPVYSTQTTHGTLSTLKSVVYYELPEILFFSWNIFKSYQNNSDSLNITNIFHLQCNSIITYSPLLIMAYNRYELHINSKLYNINYYHTPNNLQHQHTSVPESFPFSFLGGRHFHTDPEHILRVKGSQFFLDSFKRPQIFIIFH